MVSFVEEWHDMEIGLANNVVGYVKKRGDSLERQVGLHGTINPFDSIDLYRGWRQIKVKKKLSQRTREH